MKIVNRYSFFILFLVGWILSSNAQEFSSDHFDVEKLSEGVYALIHKPRGQAICNSGIIDLGDEVLVFDTFLSTIAAKDLKKAVNALIGRPIRWVVNSHSHNDHIRGNQIFWPEASIIGTVETRDYLREHGKEEADKEQNYAPARLAELRKKMDEAGEEEEKKAIAMWLGYFEAIVETYPNLKITSPNLVFSDSLWLTGSDRSVLLIEFLNGHMQSDVVLYIPEDRILFTGDLVFIKMHPYLADGDPDNLKKNLTNLGCLKVDKLVPGHGPVGSQADLGSMINYIVMLEDLAAELQVEGKSLEDLNNTSQIPPPYTDWEFPNFFIDNMKFIFGLKAKGGPM